ncbi:MAG: V-type ATP synthase subunit A [Candidatus Omnitrophica bacterium]|nr:V-type ATP synthase subunit A [Candidatus Omnitrophota bacterium]MDD5429460.1 V-type ATP synthase subunit A [Candidatus Omnitrophota bacterium]
MTNERVGYIQSIQGNMITVHFEEDVLQNEVGYVICGKEKLMAEVIRISDNTAYMQVFEDTKGVKVGDRIEFSLTMLSVKLGPGLLGQVYDGLQNPLPELAKKFGFFLPRGIQLDALNSGAKWHFFPLIKTGKKTVSSAEPLGYVQEGIFKHYIMVPFDLTGEYSVEKIASEGDYTIKDTIAILRDSRGNNIKVGMAFDWPIKIPIKAYRQKLTPKEPLTTKIRIIDTFFPVAKGGTYCIPGPFGAGKTVLQQLTSRYADVDVVILAACGERAGEVVETLRKFPELNDPRTGKSLMERTIIICNTSSMPVAARDASVYTAATLGEYYRQMGLNVLLLADSTSRWAQAMREVSGRLEEIPGEEAYPAYLESRIAEFYERSGLVELFLGEKGSLTIGGTVSPAGGNFDEPVTQATLKVVGAFHGLSRDRANARRFPSIDPLESWSRYPSFIAPEVIKDAREMLIKGNEVGQMMKVIGEEGTSMDDFIIYLKAEFLDSVYLQQNGFDKVDAATGLARQEYVFGKIYSVLNKKLNFDTKDNARKAFHALRQLFVDWNYKEWESQEFKEQERKIEEFLDTQMSAEDKGR